ncbi:hypothetical protein [Cryptosporangium minutisporangium]|uniref:Uncharacterized protein n=1 Tax=Cryptosporangium minutisporangium TaxID=113569 RepID=A0ABP6TCB5_9ACTN
MTANADSVLVGLLRSHVEDLLAWLGDYPDDQVDADALASVRQSIDWVAAQQPAREHDALATAAGLIIELMWWLDTCGDDEVEPHVAVKMQEGCAGFLTELPDEQRRRLIDVLDEEAAAEVDPARRYWLRYVPFAIGLVEEEPDESPGAREWVRPEVRSGRNYPTGRSERPQ